MLPDLNRQYLNCLQDTTDRVSMLTGLLHGSNTQKPTAKKLKDSLSNLPVEHVHLVESFGELQQRLLTLPSLQANTHSIGLHQVLKGPAAQQSEMRCSACITTIAAVAMFSCNLLTPGRTLRHLM